MKTEVVTATRSIIRLSRTQRINIHGGAIIQSEGFKAVRQFLALNPPAPNLYGA